MLVLSRPPPSWYLWACPSMPTYFGFCCSGKTSLFDRQSPCYGFGTMRTIKALAAFFRLWRLLETSLQREMASLYRWWKGSWDPYNHGTSPILKEASMRGGKLLPLHGDSEPTSQLNLETSLGIGWSQSFAIYFLKTPFTKPGASATLRQSANWCTLFGGFPPLAWV